MFVTVKRDGRVALEVNKAEIGQGVTTGYATLVAEELDVPLDAIDIHLADSLPEYRTSFLMHQTGGSTSTKEAYGPLRVAAASARVMLVGAAAATWNVPVSECHADAGRVVHRASGRALPYGELTVKAAHQPVPDAPRLKTKADFKLIGKQGRRVDGRAKVDGSARFGMDTVVPGMVRAVVLHGPVYGADPVSVEASRARLRPGVLDVFPIRGGVAVVADKTWQALAAAREVLVTWSAGEVAGLDTEKLRKAVRDHVGPGEAARDDGDAAGALAKAARRVEAVYEGPFLAHAPMEPQNCIVSVKGDKVEVWAPIQSPTMTQAWVADALGVSANDVLVHTVLAGGGFGRRAFADFVAQAARIAQHVGRPVQLVWSRESDMTQGFYRPQMTAKAIGAIEADGDVAASIHSLAPSLVLGSEFGARGVMPGIPKAVQDVLVSSLFGMFSSNTVPDMFATEGIRDSPYRIKDFRVGFTPVRTKLPVAFWRSVGHSFNGFVMESFVDELAHEARVDPASLRRRLLPEASRARRVLDAVVTMSGWGTPTPKGVARGLARHESFETEVAEVAEVEIQDGLIRVKRVFVAVDCGTVINPDIVRAQVEGAVVFGLSAALHQEITLERGVVQQTNFDTFPLLRLHECPEIIVKILESDAPPTGIGEPGLPPIAPAVANAVFALTGTRLRRLPLQRAWEEAAR
jgi:CO/xanthine dehydrogenase Mo-binding subunit